MRFLTNSMLAVLIAVAITGCSGGSSSSADNSGAAASSASDNGGAMSSADNSGASSDNSAGGSGGAAASDNPPDYPGAATQASGAANGNSGKVETTADSFDKVYAWYQKNMPSGSEKSHTDAPMKSAVFTVGEAGKDMQSVTITTAGGKTMITIAHAKSAM